MDIETRFFSAGTPLSATVHIPDEGNESLRGKLYEMPPQAAVMRERYPMVVLLHGGGRDRNDGLDTLAETLGRSGFASLRFDFRGCGSESRDRYRTLNASQMPYDLKNALNYCESLPFVDRARMGLCGISMGAGLTLRALGTGESRVISAAVMAPGAGGERTRRRRWGAKYDEIMELLLEDARITAATGHSRVLNRIDFIGQGSDAARAGIIEALLIPGNNAYTTLESVRDSLNVSSLDYAPSIHCPLFVVRGSEDTLVPQGDVDDLLAALPKDTPREFKLYEGIDHNMAIHKSRTAVFDDIANWFQRTL